MLKEGRTVFPEGFFYFWPFSLEIIWTITRSFVSVCGDSELNSVVLLTWTFQDGAGRALVLEV